MMISMTKRKRKSIINSVIFASKKPAYKLKNYIINKEDPYL